MYLLSLVERRKLGRRKTMATMPLCLTKVRIYCDNLVLVDFLEIVVTTTVPVYFTCRPQTKVDLCRNLL